MSWRWMAGVCVVFSPFSVADGKEISRNVGTWDYRQLRQRLNAEWIGDRIEDGLRMNWSWEGVTDV